MSNSCESVHQLLFNIDEVTYIAKIIVKSTPSADGETVSLSGTYTVHEAQLNETKDGFNEVREISGDELEKINNDVVLHFDAVYSYLTGKNSEES